MSDQLMDEGHQVQKRFLVGHRRTNHFSPHYSPKSAYDFPFLGPHSQQLFRTRGITRATPGQVPDPRPHCPEMPSESKSFIVGMSNHNQRPPPSRGMFPLVHPFNHPGNRVAART